MPESRFLRNRLLSRKKLREGSMVTERGGARSQAKLGSCCSFYPLCEEVFHRPTRSGVTQVLPLFNDRGVLRQGDGLPPWEQSR